MNKGFGWVQEKSLFEPKEEQGRRKLLKARWASNNVWGAQSAPLGG